ncbi:hypothetical protein Tco_0228288 [Tanacetum coccineum]
MLVEKKYPLRKEVLKQMLKLKLESEEESTMALELIKFVKKILTELESEEHKNWLVHKQTACGKDFSNPFMVDNLPKIVGLSTHLASVVKSWLVHDQTVHALASPKANELTIPEQTATGKGTSNPLMAGENVNFAKLIWEDFMFQIGSRKISKQKKELLPFSRFTKLIIKHILSQNNHISKIPHSFQHVIKLDTPLGNLKFTNKGTKDLGFGMAIPMVMLSDKIKASEDYLNYLDKSTGTQPVKVKGKGKGLLTKKGDEVVVETVRIPKKRCSETVIEETCQSENFADEVNSKETESNKEEEPLIKRRQTSVIIGREAYRESDEENLDQSMKMKGIEMISATAQFKVFLEVLDEPRDSSSSLSSESDDKIKDISSDEERSEADNTKKADAEKVKADKAHEEKADEEKKEKPAATLISSSLTLSSTEYTNQFLNDTADVSLINVLKEPTEIEVQSMVDVQVRQEHPTDQRPPLVDATVRMIPKKQRFQLNNNHQNEARLSLSSKSQRNLKLKLILMISLRDSQDLSQRLKKCQKNYHSEAIKSIQAQLKKVLPKAVPDIIKITQEKVQSKKKRHHDDQDPPAFVDKESKKRKRKDPDETVQDDAMDAEQVNEDDFVDTQDDAAPTQDRSKMDKITKAGLEGRSFKLLKGNYRKYIKLEYNMEQCYLALTSQLDWVNLEGNRRTYDLSKPLPLQGPPGRTTIPVAFFFNKDLEHVNTNIRVKRYLYLMIFKF